VRPPRLLLLDIHLSLTPADHQTHRRLHFGVPDWCRALFIDVRYLPKRLDREQSRRLTTQALERQAAGFVERVGQTLAQQWAVDQRPRAANRFVSNLVTVSLDDAGGRYRGTNHRRDPEQHLFVGVERASPGLYPGSLPAGSWDLTVSSHTLVSPHCEVVIQIAADSPDSAPRRSLSSA
jgi:hypothetical protein